MTLESPFESDEDINSLLRIMTTITKYDTFCLFVYGNLAAFGPMGRCESECVSERRTGVGGWAWALAGTGAVASCIKGCGPVWCLSAGCLCGGISPVHMYIGQLF